MLKKDNWLSWSFDDVVASKKQKHNSIYKNIINKQHIEPQMTLKDALYFNASHMKDSTPEKFDVLFSGGIDSEVILRTFKDLGISHNTFIFRYEDNLNASDVNYAVTFCEALSIPYKIIDLNLKKFFETEAIDFFNKTYAPRAPRLVHCKFFDFLDNIPVMGDGDPYWKKLETGWKLNLGEDGHCSTVYTSTIGRKSICDWYEYSPEILTAFCNHTVIQDLINDKLEGKQSSYSSRWLMYKEIWPEITYRQKLTGFEISIFPYERYEYVEKFQKEVIKDTVSETEYYYNYQEILSLVYDKNISI